VLTNLFINSERLAKEGILNILTIWSHKYFFGIIVKNTDFLLCFSAPYGQIIKLQT